MDEVSLVDETMIPISLDKVESMSGPRDDLGTTFSVIKFLRIISCNMKVNLRKKYWMFQLGYMFT